MHTGISIVVVSYNTREMLLDCLRCVYASRGPVKPEVIVIDNASSDGSAAAAGSAFPRCTVIPLMQNVGFSRASNMGIRRSSSPYVLLLNPDTKLQEDVLAEMAAYMDANRDAGMVSCKLLTGDGSLDLACRRSFPSLWDGFCRAAGLSRLFPGSRLFSRYNVTYLDEDETCDVDAVNGAFMFVRRRAIDEVGLLDEDYFMYIEDLDWCRRFHDKGWRVVYHPAAVTLHLKGQSASPHSSRMIRELFKSTEIFYRKHCFPGMGTLHRRLILLGLRLWKNATLLMNFLRRNKRTRP